MVIPAVIYSLLFLSTFFEQRSFGLSVKKLILILWTIVLTLFRGLRWDTGTDWNQYLKVFEVAKWDNIFSFSRNSSTSMEFGYVFLNVIVKTLGGDYTMFLLVTNFFVLYTYLKFSLSNSDTPIFIFVLLIFGSQFFPVRIGIAVAVIFFGLIKFSEKKYLQVTVCTLLAATIHTSAIVFLPVYFLAMVLPKLPTLLTIGLAFALLVISQNSLYNELLFVLAGGLDIVGEEASGKFENYLNYNTAKHSGAVVAFSGIFNNLIFIVFLFLFGRLSAKKIRVGYTKINFSFLFNVYFVFMMIAIAFPGENMAGLRRLQNYFMFAFPLLFSNYVVEGKRENPSLGIFYISIFVFFLIFRAYSLFFAGHLDSNFPYKSIIQEAF